MDRINVIEKLFCKPIFGGTKAEDLFKIINNFMDINNINWESYLDVCTIVCTLWLINMEDFRL